MKLLCLMVQDLFPGEWNSRKPHLKFSYQMMQLYRILDLRRSHRLSVNLRKSLAAFTMSIRMIKHKLETLLIL